jgi:putative membrane protein
MSPLSRVAALATITIGTFAVTAAPAAAEPSTPAGSSTPPEPSASSTPSASSESATSSASATHSASSTPSSQDAQFLQQAHQTNLAEIATGQLAKQKGNSQTVKNLGTKFVTDHTNLDRELKSVAQTLGVSLPQAPNANQQAVFHRLKATSGSQFENLFVTSQLAGHMHAIQADQTEIANGSNPQAVKVARDSLPVTESHHQALEAAARLLGIPLSATPLPTASPRLLPTSPSQSVHS